MVVKGPQLGQLSMMVATWGVLFFAHATCPMQQLTCRPLPAYLQSTTLPDRFLPCLEVPLSSTSQISRTARVSNWSARRPGIGRLCPSERACSWVLSVPFGLRITQFQLNMDSSSSTNEGASIAHANFRYAAQSNCSEKNFTSREHPQEAWVAR